MIEFITLAVVLASFYIAWNIGSNDTANAMGTAVGANILSYRRAATLLILFVILGAVLEGYKVMKPVGEGLIQGSPGLDSPLKEFPTAVVIAMVSAGLFVTLSTKFGLPVSTHQAIIGALAGAGIAMSLFSSVVTSVNWGEFITIIEAWVVTPLAAAFFAYLFYRIFEVPIKRVEAPEKLNLLFTIAVIVSGCYLAYVIGANGVGTAMAAMYATGRGGGSSVTVMQQLALLGAVGVAVGSLTYSRNVIKTVGMGITALGPMSAFTAQLGAALTIHIFTQWGLPTSTSHAIVGGVVGAGLVRGVAAVSGRKMGQIVLAWIATPTVSMILAFLLTAAFILV
jgi:PiT family inorganic phosphate transporter